MLLFARIWKHIRQSWVSRISTIITVIGFGIGLLGIHFIIPQIGYWIIGVIALVIVLYDVIRELHTENLELVSPSVTFEVQVNQPMNVKGHSKLFDLDLLEVGVLELYSKLSIRNTRPQPTIIHFEIISIDTDLPIAEQSHNLEVFLPSQKQKSNILELDLSKWEKDVRIEFNLNLKMSPVVGNLRLIGKANFLNFTVRATQSDGGFTDLVFNSPEICDWVRERIIERSIQRIQGTHAGRQPNLNPRDFAKYISLVWKDDKDS